MSARSLVVAVVVLAAPRVALAFHPSPSFEASANEGGGNAIYFTGSPRQKGYDCTICHVDSAGIIVARVEASPALAGAYAPDGNYAVAVTLVGEHRGFGAAANQNSFLAEIVDDAGASAGSFGDLDATLFRPVDGGRVLGGTPAGRTSWAFSWRAPPAGAGAVTLYLGMVDGDGAGAAATALTDPGGDDVAMVALRLCEGAPGCPDRPQREPEGSLASGCQAGAGAGGGAALLVVLLAFGRRRRAVALVALVALGACFDPTLPGECADRICGRPDAAPAPDASTCPESWTCTSWEAPPGSDMATRTCVDQNQAGTTECKPDEGPVLLPDLDLDFFKCRVHPIAQRGCSMMACHGTDTGRPYRVYARGRLRNNQIVERTGTCLQTGQVNLQEAGSGTVMCEGWLPHTPEEWKKNFDSARSFMLGVDAPEASLLLTMPTVGGPPHVEVKLLRESDAAYRTIRDWLGGAELGQTCNTGAN